MSKTKAILLVPAEGDPRGLLKEGPCGARPPMAYWYKRAWAPCTAKSAHSHDKRRALVLAWDGKPVREGCFRAVDALDSAPMTQGSGEWPYSGEVPSWQRLTQIVQANVDYGKWRALLRRILGKLGIIVLLDADGKEIPCPT